MSAAAHADRRTRGRSQQQQQVFDMEEPAVMPGEDFRVNHEVSKLSLNGRCKVDSVLLADTLSGGR